MTQNYSPYFGAPGPRQPLEELAEGNPVDFARYLNMKRDTQYDYRDYLEFLKHPTTSGVPGRSW